MLTDRVGRLLVASMHESITELLPLRLGFYEHWLNEGGLRQGTIGLAPFLAVLSFLRQEGDVYHAVTARAGEHAADWTVASLSTTGRSLIRRVPKWLRARLVLRLVSRLARNGYLGSRVAWTVRRGVILIRLGHSVFCDVRGPVTHPLCTFYASACTRLLTQFELPTGVDIVSCRGTGESTCELMIRLRKPAIDKGVSPT
jgi:hypothetical protein